MTGICDCLVLKIDELSSSEDIETTLYILYDKMNHHFIIRGQRFNEEENCNPYSFNCEFAADLEVFIKFVLNNGNKIMYEMLNYQDLPKSNDDITFEYLDENNSPANQVIGFMPNTYSSKKVLTMLRMMRDVFNYY
jgi:hypothetical protein